MSKLVKTFGRIDKVLNTPNLLDLQLQSYADFLQKDVPPASRDEIGLEGALRSVFPIEDFYKTATLEYVSYMISEPKYDKEECLSKGLSYEAPIYLKIQLINYNVDPDTGERTGVDVIKEESGRDGKGMYFGSIPLMTDKATFIINGTERVLVNQLQRSPGILFDHDEGKTHVSKKVLYSCRVIPMRGSWLDFDFDHKDILYVRIDRRRKMPATILLKAMGLSKEEILHYFYRTEGYVVQGNAVYREINPELLRRERVYADLYDAEGKLVAKAGKEITKPLWFKICKSGLKAMQVDPQDLVDEYMAEDFIDAESGEVLAELGDKISPDLLDLLLKDQKEIKVLHTKGLEVSSTIIDTLEQDKTEDKESAQIEIYRRLRPSSPPTPEVAETFFNNIFRNPDYYDLSPVGRYKLNIRLNLDYPLDHRTLTNEDIMKTLEKLVRLKETLGPADDIDHLGNRRVRSVGELVENQYRIGLVRMERAIKERMTQQEVATLMPHDLINSKPVTAVIKEFFGTSQLSQFMDQTNPLSEVTHKRRLSALGPGGLTRERAGFEVRDVHTSHYGRICPIETPEGPNIGLIVSLTTYAQVNKFGFIETPYRVARDGQVTTEIVYKDAARDNEEVIAQANAPLDASGRFVNERVASRDRGDFALVKQDQVTLMDIAPSQIVSISAALIPFLEHDDANRALMGSNMQRQAVPLLQSEPPLVGTGMERIVAVDSGNCVLAESEGMVEYVDADTIVVSYAGTRDNPETGEVKVHNLQKFHKSNQNSCFGQTPRVSQGQSVDKATILADGPCVKDGELALGKNLLVAFMPWGGYNFEDAILISERCVKEDVFTSIHIEEFEVLARDTKLGPEEVTRDIPNVSEDMLRNLDESGVIRIGAKIKPDDILVGKITPKGETQLTPEERLLRAIFGDKARDVKNTSLRVPPGIEGTVLDVKVFNRRSAEKDDRTKFIEDYELDQVDRKQRLHIEGLNHLFREKMWTTISGKSLAKSIPGKTKGKVLAEANKPVKQDRYQDIPLKKFRDGFISKDVNDQVRELLEEYDRQLEVITAIYDRKRKTVTEGDDMPPGIIKMVKVYIAVKRKLSVGDKMAGRHGNKGVVSCILPEEDMPFFDDGTPVDIVLNPLGVPSRMNIGQILETHLGWAAKELGKQLNAYVHDSLDMEKIRQEIKRIFAAADGSSPADDMSDAEVLEALKDMQQGIVTKTPVFDGAREEEIWNWLKMAGLPGSGKTVLYDGKTGDAFHNTVTVGYMYMLKLHHLVDEKIHARSTGPYSLVTQQPLGGKAQFGGQRLGEMEVWALEAYGAAHMLQEFLTVKADDVHGRVKMYENIVKGENYLTTAMPESFNVLVKELMALGLDVSLVSEEKKRKKFSKGA